MKFFVVSDIHSFLGPFKKALEEKGFDPENEQHYIVSCGDLFDRGPDSEEVLHYIMQLPRKILVKGNHDSLLEECCMREFPYHYDSSNGTVRTIQDIGDMGMGYTFDECCQRTWNKTARYRELLVNYFETQNYIFVHSWIPTEVTYDERASKPWHQIGKTYSYKEEWRTATEKEWEEAMWGNPFILASQDLNKTGKTIVFGHWHCSAGHSMLQATKISENESESPISEFEDDAIWEPCYFKNNTIGIDRCTAHTGKVNVLVLEDDFLENSNKQEG